MAAKRESGGSLPARPGPAPGAGGRHGSGALGWLLGPPQSQSPSPHCQGLLNPGPPATGVPRRTRSVPGKPCRVDRDSGEGYSQGWGQAGLRTEGQEVPIPTELTGWSQNPSKGGCGRISPGEVGGEREAGVDRRPKIKILGAREAGDMQAERDLAARSQGTWRATELQGRAGYKSWFWSPQPRPPHFSSPPGAQEPQSKDGGQSCAGPARLHPGQAAPGRRVQSQTAVWVAARQPGGLAQGVPQALRAPGPDECPGGPFEGQCGKSVAGRPQGSV